MTVNISRSQNAEINEGATDGKYRKVRPNTTVAAGQGDQLMRANRQSLHPFYNYGFIDTEDTNKVAPGSNKAGIVNSRQAATPVSDIENYQMQATQN
jgi:hypothetical protein